MSNCVYTTLQDVWIRACIEAGGKGTFQSSRPWVTAKKLVDMASPLPVFIRSSGDDAEPFRVEFRAEITSIRLASDFNSPSPAARRSWLQENLSVQRNWISNEWEAGRGEREKYADAAEQFAAWELDFKAQTFFTLENLRECEPQFPISELVKVSDHEPLAANYQRGYAICFMPQHLT